MGNLGQHALKTKGVTILSRRSLLKSAGFAIVATAIPAEESSAAGLTEKPISSDTPKSVIAELSEYMSGALVRILPDEVIEKAKLHIMDTFAAMVSGSELPPGIAALNFARAYGGEKIATVVCAKLLSGPIEAALTNGMLAHSDETDDSHSPSLSHPGCVVVPAALAVGEKFGIGGQEFLRAVVLGYDIGTRVTMTLGPTSLLHNHKDTYGISGTFGAAAASSCAANLNTQQMRWVLDYASQQASGISVWQRDTEHIEKGFAFAGMPARNGVTAALVVRSGWTGIDDVLSGTDNFFLANAPEADPAGLVEQLGERYEIARTNIKKWTVGSPIQAPLDALEIIMKQHSFQPEQVQKVTVRVASTEASIVDNREMPDISLQHMIAVMLIDKTASFRSAHDASRMKDPAILRQRDKVQLIHDDELESRLPRREAIVEVTLFDGSHFSEHVEAVRGTAENPMTREEVVAKCRDLIAPVLGSSSCGKLIETILGLEKTTDIRELRSFLQKT